jgi:transposase
MIKKTSARYSPEVRARAVRMVLEHRSDYASQWAAIGSIASKIGCTGETLRRWVQQGSQPLSSIPMTLRREANNCRMSELVGSSGKNIGAKIGTYRSRMASFLNTAGGGNDDAFERGPVGRTGKQHPARVRLIEIAQPRSPVLHSQCNPRRAVRPATGLRIHITRLRPKDSGAHHLLPCPLSALSPRQRL